jgi:hypothetical protein
MKNKKLTMLLVLVASIWGTIGYKIITQFGDDDVELRPIVKKNATEIKEVKRYTLSLAYVDPFLKKRSVALGEPSKKIIKQPKKIVVAAPVVVVDWSVIKYAGLVFNKSRKVKMGSVRINNNDYFVREGDEAEGFLMSDINSDSIKATFDTVSKYIKKE